MHKKIVYSFVMILLAHALPEYAVASGPVKKTASLTLQSCLNSFHTMYSLHGTFHNRYNNDSNLQLCKEMDAFIGKIKRDPVAQVSLDTLHQDNQIDFVYFLSLGMQSRVEIQRRDRLMKEYKRFFSENKMIEHWLHPQQSFNSAPQIIDFHAKLSLPAQLKSLDCKTVYKPADFIALREQSQQNARNWEPVLKKMILDAKKK